MNTKTKILVGLLIAAVSISAWAADGEGLLVRQVLEDSPAEAAGMIRGDVLLAIDGNEVDSQADIREILSSMKAGQRIQLTILRGGEEKQIFLTIEDRLYKPAIGLVFDAALRANSIVTLRPRMQTGVIIVEIVEDSPAEAAELEPRDAIVKVDGDRVSSDEFADIVKSHNPGDRIILSISRPGDQGGEPFDVTVTLDENDDGDAYLGIQYVQPGMNLEKFLPELRERMNNMNDSRRGMGRQTENQGRRAAPSLPIKKGGDSEL